MLKSVIEFDHSLFFWLNGLAEQNELLDALIVAIAVYLPFAVVIGFAALLVWRWRWQGVVVFATAFGAAVLARVAVTSPIRHYFPVPRPFVEYDVHQLIVWTSDAMGSFPSGHATFLFAFAAALWLHDRRLGLAAVFAALLISTARIVAGVHYPSDILAGAYLGALSGVVFSLIAAWLYQAAPTRTLDRLLLSR